MYSYIKKDILDPVREFQRPYSDILSHIKMRFPNIDFAQSPHVNDSRTIAFIGENAEGKSFIVEVDMSNGEIEVFKDLF